MAAYTKTITYNENWAMELESGVGTVAMVNLDTNEKHFIDISPNMVWLIMLATSRLHVDELCQSLFDANVGQ